ncbi:putative sodium/calcium exchanger membrane region [Medicago truncatula]|uniref:Putative sodium/calcium exchanger membrane region n=1 Tax=Medicago truncatula TaxID=3880 RepID=A0A396H4W1_MEDTR|nr:putative sodium/calcium exchanger membrane region [Medicago truncatula]
MSQMSQSKRMFFTLFLNTSFLLLFCVFLVLHFQSYEHVFLRNKTNNNNRNFVSGVTDDEDCKSFHSLSDYKAKCFYLKSNNPCVTQGYVDYLYIFYCKIGNFPLLGHTLLFLWLLVLFYLLANTASEYFCPSLDNLSKVLRLSPTIAGVTLLSLGNGANDVFATLVSFKDSVFINGEINVVVAVGFCLMYVVYVAIVYVTSSKRKGVCDEDDVDYGDSRIHGNGNDLDVPLLGFMEKGMVQVHSNSNGLQECEFKIEKNISCCEKSSIFRMLLYVLDMPLYLPRRLTIPVVCEEKWSKAYAVSSAILSPLLLAFLWIPYKENSFSNSSSLIVYGIGLLVGIILGVTAIFTTEASNPPRKFLLPWLAAGFMMSVTWSYISAQELVGLLVSLGFICGVNPSILGLTVLAWGNSIGDLVTNLTMALNGGPEGAQIAISGCYAGPIFNTVVGLGLSLVTSTWSEYPSSIVIPRDPYLWETLAFLVVGLIWALVVLIRRDMKLDGMLGGGLLAIYFISLILRLTQTLGSLQFKDILV